MEQLRPAEDFVAVALLENHKAFMPLAYTPLIDNFR
jgi:hypothetical protein